MLHWSLLAVLVAGLLSVGPVGIRAQDSLALCLPSFGWMTNSKNQNPCLVAAYLQASCNGGQFTVLPLLFGFYYTGPSAYESNQCQCSIVTYNLLSACGLCQNREIISWSDWTFNCPTPYLNYPPGIPYGTAVPHWAYQNVPPIGTFDVTLAQSVGDSPESTATVPQSTAFPTSTSLLPGSTSPSILPTGSLSSKINVGVIAGGVVGGVVGVPLIVVVAVFFIVRKPRSQIPPSVPSVSPFSPQMTQPKLHDPSDPSTFPAIPPPPTESISFVTYTYSTGTGGAYTGVPEI